MTAITYSEPNKISAGMLALLVHGAFFALLYAGFNWHTQKPENVSVELWSSLPEVEVEGPLKLPPAPAPAPAVVTPPTVQPKVVTPLAPVKPDIAVKDKKAKKVEKKPELKKPSKAELKRQEKEQALLEAQKDERVQAERKRIRAELDAAMAGEVGKYQDMIRTKIRNNIVMPPDVPATAQVEAEVILLPGGVVGPVTLTRSSGNAAYDSAVEHAIIRSKTLPVPSDPALAREFRVLHLKLKPE